MTLTGAGLDPQLLGRYRAACRSLRYWLRLTERHGSVIAALTGTGPILADTHYPEGDVTDAATGSQFYYHCHRGDAEHGHLHLFLPACVGRPLTHLIAISLDCRGLPIGLFTVNRWVADDAWLPASEMIPLLERFGFPSASGASAPAPDGPDPLLGRWLTHFLIHYRPLIAALLQERDACLQRHAQTGDLAAALVNPALEIPSARAIDWSADLAWIQEQVRSSPSPGCR